MFSKHHGKCRGALDSRSALVGFTGCFAAISGSCNLAIIVGQRLPALQIEFSLELAVHKHDDAGQALSITVSVCVCEQQSATNSKSVSSVHDVINEIMMELPPSYFSLVRSLFRVAAQSFQNGRK
jgi:hypothetical protein